MDPIEEFKQWMAAAEAAGEAEPTAMTLATASAEGVPSARMVLLKGVDRRGFVFFTNYGSNKAADLQANPQAALVFRWPVVHRQVRVVGPVTKVKAAESDAYFATRPRGSQIGAWASDQSQPVESREALERQYQAIEARFEGSEIPRPRHWGGYRVRPVVIELWEGRDNRLHDRTRYRRAGSRWRMERLSP